MPSRTNDKLMAATYKTMIIDCELDGMSNSTSLIGAVYETVVGLPYSFEPLDPGSSGAVFSETNHTYGVERIGNTNKLVMDCIDRFNVL